MAEIEAQILRLWFFALEHPDLTFLLTEVGGGLAGHRRGDLREMLDAVINEKGHPGISRMPPKFIGRGSSSRTTWQHAPRRKALPVPATSHTARVCRNNRYILPVA
jgi:hypothetical protein